MRHWNPATEPYRVRKIRRDGRMGMMGWSDSVQTYATLDEAMQAVNAKMTGGEYEAQLTMAILGPDGRVAKWKDIAKRRINKSVVLK